MNDRELASHIKQELNYGTGQVSGRVTERLKLAREQAVAAYAASYAHQPAFAFAGTHGFIPGALFTRKWLSLGLLMLALLGGAYWQQHLATQEDDVDAGLLSSDLPLNAFVDQNFHLWLDQSQQQ